MSRTVGTTVHTRLTRTPPKRRDNVMNRISINLQNNNFFFSWFNTSLSGGFSKHGERGKIDHNHATFITGLISRQYSFFRSYNHYAQLICSKRFFSLDFFPISWRDHTSLDGGHWFFPFVSLTFYYFHFHLFFDAVVGLCGDSRNRKCLMLIYRREREKPEWSPSWSMRAKWTRESSGLN